MLIEISSIWIRSAGQSEMNRQHRPTRSIATLYLLFPAMITTLGAAEHKVNPHDGPNYVLIPSGTYLMGCSPGDRECFDWEKRAKEVVIGRNFWLGQTEVTQAAFKRVIGTNPSLYKGASCPVDRVGWVDARKYCDAVGMRLPKEAEWEYAARGGTDTPMYDELNVIAWYDGNSKDQTHPVAQKLPNRYGLYDMLGNVWEWVEDAYDERKRFCAADLFIIQRESCGFRIDSGRFRTGRTETWAFVVLVIDRATSDANR